MDQRSRAKLAGIKLIRKIRHSQSLADVCNPPYDPMFGLGDPSIIVLILVSISDPFVEFREMDAPILDQNHPRRGLLGMANKHMSSSRIE